MATKQVAKKTRKPKAKAIRRLENRPRSPSGTPKTVPEREPDASPGAVLSWRADINLNLAPPSRDAPQLEYKFMAEVAQVPLLPAAQVAQEARVQQAPNGVCYASYGDTQITPEELERIVQAVPASIAGALQRRAY